MTKKPPKTNFLKDQEEQESLSFSYYVKDLPEKNPRDEGTDTEFTFRPQLPSSSASPSGEVKADPSPSSYSERPVEQGSTSQALGPGTSSFTWSKSQEKELCEKLTQLQFQETSRQVTAENQPNFLKRCWDSLSLRCQCGGPNTKTRAEEDTGPDPGEIDFGE